jgi:hypothetical protein
LQPFAGMPSVPIPAASPPPRPASLLRHLTVALLWALAWTLGGLATPAGADTINVRSAELRIEEGEILLNAEFDLSFNATLEEALQRGIPLYFVLEFELSRSRWYWLDDKVSQTSVTYRVSYNALTRQYRVALGSGLLAPTFSTLQEVERYVGRVTSRPVASVSAVTRGVKYDAALRLRLDVNQLPKPFQVSALGSREWTLSSDWYRWSFVP